MRLVFWRPAKRSDREVLDAIEAEVRALTALVKCTHQKQKELLMALSEEVKAAMAEVGGKIDAAVAGVGEAIADIQALHQKLDGLLDQGDVAGAQAALGEVSAKANALSDAIGALKGVVDIPE